MKIYYKHRLFLFIALAVIASSVIYINLSNKSSAENILNPIVLNNQQDEEKEENLVINDREGKVVFSLKTDFDSLTNFLGITEEEFFKLRKDYSMLEIAERQNISEYDLFRYLVSKRFEALESHYKDGKVDLSFIMDYTLCLKEDIEFEMNVKSIK